MSNPDNHHQNPQANQALKDFRADLETRGLEPMPVMLRQMINFLGIEGFEGVDDEDLYDRLRRQETASILIAFHRDFMEIGERQSQALGEIGGEVLTRFNNVQEFIGISLKDLAKKMPELGDDCPANLTEEFVVAGLLELLRRTVLEPVNVIVDVYPWTTEMYEQNQRFWERVSQRHDQLAHLLGIENLSSISDKYREAIWNHTINELDYKNPDWWEGKTLEEEGLILSYLRNRAEGVLDQTTNLEEIKSLVDLVTEADSLAAVKKVISIEALLKKLEDYTL